ncbi:MAG: HupE/UreJ family protein [Gammaproteobacteria bacterium]|nr:HupE/UreJ family protein [Gammaproteobacteria bacterium]
MRRPRLQSPVARPRCALALLCILGLLVAETGLAHRLRPAIVTVTFDTDGRYTAALQLNLEALLAGIGPEHEDTSQAPQAAAYDELRELPRAALQARLDKFAPRLLAGIALRFDDRPASPQLLQAEIPAVGDIAIERLTTITLAGDIPPGSRVMSWRYEPAFGDSVLRIALPDGTVLRADWLTAGTASTPFELDPALVPVRSTADVFRDYTVLGFTHILPKGLDHILFVLGIFLLSARWRPLLVQVTAFTIAHSITLALSLYGLVSLPGTVVEPLIALSIVYVAVENILIGELRAWRTWVVFGFGLLHGLGFAGVLKDLGLPTGEFLPALIAFNVGVELGQLTVIGAALLAVGLWFSRRSWYRTQLTVIGAALLAVGLWFSRRSWYRTRVVIPGSALIAAVGAYWTVARIVG